MSTSISARILLSRIKTCIRLVSKAALALLCAGVIFGSAAHCEAQDHRDITPRLVPPLSPTGQPLLGFTGQMHYGQGLVVMSVRPGSLAQQLGLERNDVLVGINGQQIYSLDHYYQLLRNSGGFVQLELIDCRTGNMAGIDFYLDNGSSNPVAAAPVGGPQLQGPPPVIMGPAFIHGGPTGRPPIVRRY